MKKLWLLFLLPILFFAFGSCKKGDGIFHPDKKLSKIYDEHQYVDSWLGDTIYSRNLREIWTWDGDNLSKIEGVSGEAIYFEYNKNGRLKKMQSDNVELVFHYLGNNFNKIEIESSGGRVTGTYTFKHKSGKISEIEIKTKEVGGGLGKNAEMETVTRLLGFFMPEAVTQTLLASNTQALKEANAKGTPSVTYTNTMEFEWNGDDVSKATLNAVYEDTWGNVWKNKNIITCQYDTKQNPYHNLFSSILNVTGLSKHNVIYSKTESEDPTPVIVNYRYDYEGEYPVKRTEFFVTDDVVDEYLYYTCYEYKN